ncbi:cysteine dioxygenase type 1 [Nematostella vectensis]|uniref:cysteine dioxygenase type 1 n=1 Tax=Nematostella vectensis TaxID=45351 RepID=UPI00207704DA|nr:cysteine dioxygenase type 1 [Nematostella vectensis]XP_048581329.1 cysteine dioxygenase type 1 [Nematostella vectensis]
MASKAKIKAPENLDELIRELHEVFESDRVDIDQVKTLMESYRSNQDDWQKYANYDPFRYTRNLVDEGNGKFNLIVLCWGEGQGSSIHDHTDSHCFLKVLDGKLKETLFEWPSESEPEKPLAVKGVSYVDRDEVAYINDSIGLHRMENTSHSDTACSLHLYCPPFDMCNSFDQRTGHKRKCKVTFWSKYGERTPFTPGC